MDTKKEILDGKDYWDVYLAEFEMSDFARFAIKNEIKEYVHHQRLSMLDDAARRIKAIKKEVQKTYGTFKYDSCYDDCLAIIHSLREEE